MHQVERDEHEGDVIETLDGKNDVKQTSADSKQRLYSKNGSVVSESLDVSWFYHWSLKCVFDCGALVKARNL